MKGRKGRFLFTLFLTLLVFGFGTRIVRADETDNFQSDKKSIETAETKILEEEFDFKEIEKSLSELFPKEKISFEEVVFSFLKGEPGEMLELLTGYIRDEIAYEFLCRYGGCIQQFCGSFSKQTDFGNKFLRCIYAFDHALFDVFSDGGLWNQ